MKTVRLFKMPFQTGQFNLNQKVFVIWEVDQAAYCYGRHRGKGRFIKAYVSWATKCRSAPRIVLTEMGEECHIARVCGYTPIHGCRVSL